MAALASLSLTASRGIDCIFRLAPAKKRDGLCSNLRERAEELEDPMQNGKVDAA
ncbi:MAG: hypothetical protein LBU32_02810 [Clostridiales bacterium]|nr:hypothetical protein [Clostridiales bacterium]